jgi:hypothetical protein
MVRRIYLQLGKGTILSQPARYLRPFQRANTISHYKLSFWAAASAQRAPPPIGAGPAAIPSSH